MWVRAPGAPSWPMAMREITGRCESVKKAASFVTTTSLMNVEEAGARWYSRTRAWVFTS